MAEVGAPSQQIFGKVGPSTQLCHAPLSHLPTHQGRGLVWRVLYFWARLRGALISAPCIYGTRYEALGEPSRLVNVFIFCSFPAPFLYFSAPCMVLVLNFYFRIYIFNFMYFMSNYQCFMLSCYGLYAMNVQSGLTAILGFDRLLAIAAPHK